ncbi:serine/threonine protein kinase [Streptomyces graminilatus]|uniref:serine/threonine protein kinase n=1 Tax=Streptomyces graminilatus TaxID=1464070 RepID=UPI00099EF042|nr:serine/threonine-protein kinase [Streptomyces graminilatus]
MVKANVSTHELVAGRYRLLDVVDRETNRVCWYGEDTAAERPVVLTQIQLPPDPRDQTARRVIARVTRASEILGLMLPGRVGTVTDMTEEFGTLWTVAKWIDGTPLSELLERQGTFNYVRAARIALEVLDVLEAAHGEGIVHAELSPGQVFVRDQGPVVVTGFGLAGATPASRIGAPSYASPEQAHGARPEPSDDLWALGALLFRAVQGHAPYPEESTAELVQLVCAEPPAFAEECGPLRPVVESLLRQDPTERLDFEELNGWLRSLVRSAPEPEAGAHVVAAPPTDPRRLPIVRRRGELVRRRRAGLPATEPHGRHKRARQEPRAPRRLGRNLLLLILLALAGAIAYAMYFMPKAGSDGVRDGERTGSAGEVGATPEQSSDAPDASSEPRPEQTSPGGEKGNSASPPAGSAEPPPADGPAAGFTVRNDPAGFRVAVADGWDRTGKNGQGQVVYSHGSFQLIVVPGRDTTKKYGADPMTYQREREYELQPFRDSTWATSSGMRTIDVGGRTMAEGQFTWQNSSGGEVFVRNLAIVVDGRYHVVQLRGPEAERDEVTRLYEQASATYRPTG